MTSEEKVKQVYPKAWCATPPFSPWAIYEFHRGQFEFHKPLGISHRCESSAWADAWRRIQAARKESA